MSCAHEPKQFRVVAAACTRGERAGDVVDEAEGATPVERTGEAEEPTGDKLDVGRGQAGDSEPGELAR